jgi:DMSO/TMAO reductase YedYZ molybdopterin-dependent catalytic subunit
MQQAKMEPTGFFRRIPLLPHQMHGRLTPTADMIVLCHLGIPRLDREAWSLEVDGLVERSTQIDFSQLTTYPKHTVTSFHQCAGSPLQPLEPTQRICNVRWGGARLADVLRDCGPAPNARYVWSWGADYGAFGGSSMRLMSRTCRSSAYPATCSSPMSSIRPRFHPSTGFQRVSLFPASTARTA